MGSVLVSASMRRVYKGDDVQPSAPPPQAPAVPHSRMREPPPPTATRLLPFDLRLLQGNDGLTLFPKGRFDEFTFFQRTVPGDHELEFVTCLDQAGDDEDAQGYGLFRLKGPSETLLDLSRQRDLWQRVNERHRLDHLPNARNVITRTPHSYDPLRGEHTGRNCVTPPKGALYRAKGQRALTYRRALEILRGSCRPRQLIAWIEAGIPRTRPGTVLHRYYIDANRNLYLVRHEHRTRQLFIPSRCEASEVRARSVHVRVPEWPPTRRAAA